MTIRLFKSGTISGYESRSFSYKSDESNNFPDVTVQKGGHFYRREGKVRCDSPSEAEFIEMDSATPDLVYDDLIEVEVDDQVREWLSLLPLKGGKVYYGEEFVGLSAPPKAEMLEAVKRTAAKWRRTHYSKEYAALYITPFCEWAESL